MSHKIFLQSRMVYACIPQVLFFILNLYTYIFFSFFFNIHTCLGHFVLCEKIFYNYIKMYHVIKLKKGHCYICIYHSSFSSFTYHTSYILTI